MQWSHVIQHAVELNDQLKDLQKDQNCRTSSEHDGERFSSPQAQKMSSIAQLWRL